MYLTSARTNPNSLEFTAERKLKRVLVLGVTGMLGNAMLKQLLRDTGLETWGTVRSDSGTRFTPESCRSRIIDGVDVIDQDALLRAVSVCRPHVIINCVGLIKQLDQANDPLAVLPINAILPHRLSRLCAAVGARLIHISTDCVFSGKTGGYRESDPSDAEDLYGKSKHLGEIGGEAHVITLRTSIIGHELQSRRGLIDWFLSQEGDVPGFSRAIFSGLPTVELARVIREFVIPNESLSGLYHVAARAISKLDLLRLVADVYGKKVNLIPDDRLRVDRSLDPGRFGSATGYVAPEWPALIQAMRESMNPNETVTRKGPSKNV